MRIAVIGAGNGGHAMAGHLTLQGHDVVLFSRTASKLEAIERRGGVALSGAIGDAVVPLAGTTSDMATAVQGADLVAVTVPGMVQTEYLDLIVPHIRAGQALWFVPGNAVTLMARPLLAAAGKEDVLLIEASTLTYAVRATAPASVKVTYVLSPRCAAFPAKRNDEALELLRELFPLPGAGNVLDAALNNVNPMIHVAPALLNMGSIDARDGVFSIYGEGMTPSVLRTMEALDAERLELLERLGLEGLPLDGLYEELGTGPIYRESMGVGRAERFEPRFLSEDVPVGLVAMASLAREHNAVTPLTDALVNLASAVDQVDYWSVGRTAAVLGIDGMDVARLHDYLHEGR